MLWSSLGLVSGEGLETCRVLLLQGNRYYRGSIPDGLLQSALAALMKMVAVFPQCLCAQAWHRSACLQLQGSYGETSSRDQIPRSFCPASLECAAVSEGACIEVEGEDQHVYLQACTCTCAPQKHHTSPSQKWKKQKSSLL